MLENTASFSTEGGSDSTEKGKRAENPIDLTSSPEPDPVIIDSFFRRRPNVSVRGMSLLNAQGMFRSLTQGDQENFLLLAKEYTDEELADMIGFATDNSTKRTRVRTLVGQIIDDVAGQLNVQPREVKYALEQARKASGAKERFDSLASKRKVESRVKNKEMDEAFGSQRLLHAAQQPAQSAPSTQTPTALDAGGSSYSGYAQPQLSTMPRPPESARGFNYRPLVPAPRSGMFTSTYPAAPPLPESWQGSFSSLASYYQPQQQFQIQAGETTTTRPQQNQSISLQQQSMQQRQGGGAKQHCLQNQQGLTGKDGSQTIQPVGKNATQSSTAGYQALRYEGDKDQDASQVGKSVSEQTRGRDVKQEAVDESKPGRLDDIDQSQAATETGHEPADNGEDASFSTAVESEEADPEVVQAALALLDMKYHGSW